MIGRICFLRASTPKLSYSLVRFFGIQPEPGPAAAQSHTKVLCQESSLLAMFHSIHSGKLRGAAPILLAFLLIKELERDVDTHNTVNSVNTHTLTADQPFVP